jgi:uncharacterized protein YjiS (DUF1127 family)
MVPTMTKHRTWNTGKPNWRGSFAAMRALFALWSRRRETRRHLRDLDSRLLRDIGLDEQDRVRECAKWPWQGAPDDSDTTGPASKNARSLRARVRSNQNEKADQAFRRNRTTTSTRAIS